jgi:hypothetical protein
MAPYKAAKPIDCEAAIDAKIVQRKTGKSRTITFYISHILTVALGLAIVTGGALGIGEAYVRALVAYGAFFCHSRSQ